MTLQPMFLNLALINSFSQILSKSFMVLSQVLHSLSCGSLLILFVSFMNVLCSSYQFYKLFIKQHLISRKIRVLTFLFTS